MNYIVADYKIECLDELNIKYAIYKSKRKRLSASFNEKGILIIKQPLHFSSDLVVSFINKNIDWIVKHYRILPLAHEEVSDYFNNPTYLLLGKSYKLEIIYNRHEEVILKDDILFCYTSDNLHIEKLLEEFRIKQAEIVFNEILFNAFNNFKVNLNKYPTLVIKKYKSKWGCCYYNENKILLNLSLIHVPFELIEYIVYHELTHFVYHDHSKEFHTLLKKYVPREVELRKKLAAFNPLYK